MIECKHAKECMNFKENPYNCVNHNFRLFNGNCANYEGKLPKVTQCEVGMKFYELNKQCSAIRKFYGVEVGAMSGCFDRDCGGLDCTTALARIINEARGYTD